MRPDNVVRCALCGNGRGLRYQSLQFVQEDVHPGLTTVWVTHTVFPVCRSWDGCYERRTARKEATDGG